MKTFTYSTSLLAPARATLHCLQGCIVGEIVGLLIGVILGFDPWLTITLATILAYVTGFAFGLSQAHRVEGIDVHAALKMIWIGELISIGVMEIAINVVDYLMGGPQASSVFAPTFWLGLIVAIPVGFFCAWPVNWWLIKIDLKKCSYA